VNSCERRWSIPGWVENDRVSSVVQLFQLELILCGFHPQKFDGQWDKVSREFSLLTELWSSKFNFHGKAHHVQAFFLRVDLFPSTPYRNRHRTTKRIKMPRSPW
jgi:hypothetical protein